ncbi:MAG: T9SS type A sorting domain-containing protein, partial [Saprospiraceae bacterium]|nr:T9SS type A sorting domain-containing protein [Saprospiraceae bacterium]
FPNFPWNGGTHDVVKVCFTNSGAVGCCKTLEFEVPDCLGNDPCHIYDMVAVRTACLCGQFFVAINFEHQNGGSGGFDIVGNGQNYGNFPYNTTQPIILGPFTGDGTTAYEFAIQDHLHPDCHDAVEIGVVECQTPANEPGNGSSLTISPNPASSWVNVTAMLGNGADMGQATVKIYHADGRLLQSLVVANGAAFQLDVNNLSAGVFRLSIQSGSGNLEGSFTKQ